MAIKDFRIKLIQLLTMFAVLFACAGLNAAGIVGRRVPRMRVRQWLTPNPPTEADLEARVYVVKFWATWCPFCVDAVPHMINLTKKYTPKGVLFIGLSRDKSIAEVKKFIRQKKINYHIGMDTGISKRFLFVGIPMAFVISHTGKVIWQGSPMSKGLEAAIVSALEKAPPPFLAGIELGPYEDLRWQLSGGRDFARVYRRLKTQAEKGESDRSEKAAKIIKEIDNRIDKKIQEAAKLRQSDPLAAFMLYRRILKKYRGIEATKPAALAHDELRNDKRLNNEIAADRALIRVERLLTRCRGCSSCGDFTLACKRCVELNPTAVERVEKNLKDICKNYAGTKAAKKAQVNLKELNSKVAETE